ncbi:hypothetical protein ISN44_As13g026900 [Arabidopsis suecica]|uniref:Plant thionin family protein n=1 Tax=Arabidopsis suecica TaxID=45249 RepID=A0A8T1XWN1_ARASU|nr:hypothetical protein ISN44_As13g026900 [Arabidopsis suecica]
MESKWSVVMMVYFVFVVIAAIGGEAEDHLSCETKCAITCKDSMFPKKCSTKCLESCRRYPPTQLHTRMMAAAIEGEPSLGCSFKCEIHCKTPFPTTACFKRCIRERCEHLPPTSTFHSTSHSPMKSRGLKEKRW